MKLTLDAVPQYVWNRLIQYLGGEFVLNTEDYAGQYQGLTVPKFSPTLSREPVDDPQVDRLADVFHVQTLRIIPLKRASGPFYAAVFDTVTHPKANRSADLYVLFTPSHGDLGIHAIHWDDWASMALAPIGSTMFSTAREWSESEQRQAMCDAFELGISQALWEFIFTNQYNLEGLTL